MRRAVLFSAALLLLPLLAACSASEPNTPTEVDELSVGQTAPAFTLPSAAGSSVSLSDCVSTCLVWIHVTSQSPDPGSLDSTQSSLVISLVLHR